jgi:hypothetical protein
MAADAQGDEIHFAIVTKLTSRAEMVHLEVRCASTVLAAPSIAVKHLAPQFPIRSRAKLEPRPLGARAIHETFRICSRNSTF